jgi:hypothetical protein
VGCHNLVTFILKCQAIFYELLGHNNPQPLSFIGADNVYLGEVGDLESCHFWFVFAASHGYSSVSKEVTNKSLEVEYSGLLFVMFYFIIVVV